VKFAPEPSQPGYKIQVLLSPRQNKILGSDLHCPNRWDCDPWPQPGHHASIDHVGPRRARSTLGRTLSDRIATFLDKLPVKERLQLARDLAAKTTNPGVKIAILAQAKDGSFYQGSSLTVAEQLGRLTPPGTNIAAERDRVVLAACMRYLMTLHPLLIKVIWQDFLKGSIFADNATIARSPFYANAYPALDRIRHPDFWASLKGLEALTSVNTSRQHAF
jgi:hypothetical protein